jgi:hypothetical protein
MKCLHPVYAMALAHAGCAERSTAGIRQSWAYAEIRVKCGHIARSLMIPGNLIVCICIQSACRLLILRESVFRDIGFFQRVSEHSSSG